MSNKYRDYPENLYSQAQADWCRYYEQETSFEPAMDEYEAGNCTFTEAQDWNVAWFKRWAVETAGFLGWSSNG
ncbi:hypothetical protein, partial [Mesorhizobium japonicum]|uniref:hypothetical protein n=1 Tax=Mesorhizobium japonicum TaxID=2066070 RepID=UPI003B5A1101